MVPTICKFQVMNPLAYNLGVACQNQDNPKNHIIKRKTTGMKKVSTATHSFVVLGISQIFHVKKKVNHLK